MSEIVIILKELGLPIIGIVSMLIIYVLTIKGIKYDLKKLSLDVLQLKITNKELPPYARIAAYDEYKRKGGNSWIDVYMQQEGLLGAQHKEQ
jgi:hypothetical protein